MNPSPVRGVHFHVTGFTRKSISEVEFNANGLNREKGYDASV